MEFEQKQLPEGKRLKQRQTALSFSLAIPLPFKTMSSELHFLCKRSPALANSRLKVLEARDNRSP